MKLMLYEEWIKSPHQEDKISQENELKYRNEVIEFMRKLGFLLKVNTLTVSKAMIIFHIYSYQNSFRKFKRLHYAAAAVFLANKLDDFDYKKNFLESCAKALLFLERDGKSIRSFGPNPFEIKENEEKFKNYTCNPEKIATLREEFCEAELNLLRAIGYDFDIILPYQFINEFMSSKLINNELLWKIANIFVNDSFRTLISLYYEPIIIALAAISMAAVYLKIELTSLPNGNPWYQFFSEYTNIHTIEECANRMRDIYKEVVQ